MNETLVRQLSGAVFRASSRYRLILFDRLDENERESLAGLRQDAEFYGILRPVTEGTTFKSIDRESALLLFTLSEAGTLPAYVLDDDQAPQRLAQIVALVLDGVLEIKSGDHFVSGPEAQPLVSGTPECHPRQGVLARLAHEALRYAQSLHLHHIDLLAGRLYNYHRIPVSPRWQRRFRSAESIADHVGVGVGGPRHRLLSAWGRPTQQRDLTDWIGWQRRGMETMVNRPTYKLYVSPKPDALEAAVSGLLEVLPASRATGFKLGGDAAGLLRPDKLVVYFKDLDSLSSTSGELMRKLDGLPSHGVPFTAEIDGEGLLSWGMDPPETDRRTDWQPRESWRFWVVRRLAAAIVAAQTTQPQSDNAVSPWRFALERVRLTGIDVERWTPRPTLWNRAGP